MILSVASGKGGTGKTTVAVNLALVAGGVQLLDCDVEAPNAHLFLNPVISMERKAMVPVPEVDPERCDGCGRCQEACAFHALTVLPAVGPRKGRVLFYPNLCHGCGGCSMVCPRGAVRDGFREIGILRTGASGSIRFSDGRLNIGEAMSPPLIRQLRAFRKSGEDTIIDAPPGVSCAMVSAVKGSDYCLLVTEPTPFGLNDLTLAAEALRKMKIPFGVVINRSDLGDNRTREYCVRERVPILAEIPFSRELAAQYSEGIPAAGREGPFRDQFQALYGRVRELA